MDRALGGADEEGFVTTPLSFSASQQQQIASGFGETSSESDIGKRRIDPRHSIGNQPDAAVVLPFSRLSVRVHLKRGPSHHITCTSNTTQHRTQTRMQRSVVVSF